MLLCYVVKIYDTNYQFFGLEPSTYRFRDAFGTVITAPSKVESTLT
jgi:hypothetical protein